MTDGLKDNHRNAIIDILSANKRIERVVLFGSRAMGTYTMTSDVDLVLYGNHLTLTDQAHLADALDKLTVPQRVDLVLHNVIDNDELCKHIERHGIEWYRRQRNMGLNEAIDITDDQRKVVCTLIERHLPNTTAWVYGSRVKWTARPQSDLDMVVFTTPEQNSQVFGLREAFEESNLPFRVDLFVWDDVPERFRKHIKQDYVVFSDNANDDPVGRNWLYHPQFPRHWKRKQLYAMAQWVNGLAFREIQFSATGKPVIKIAEIKGGISGQTKFTQQAFDESVRVRFGDMLFSWSGQPETSIDAFWWRGPEGWLNQHVFRVTPINGVDSTFFFFLLRYLKPNFVAIARNKQTTGLGHVTKRDLENIEAALPDLSEQRAIAHILGTLDDKIELNRRMNETLEEMARALFKSWFVDFDPVRAKMEGRDTGLPPDVAALFPDRLVDSELGEIPEGWEVKALGELIELAYGKALKADDRKSGSIPVYGSNGQVGWHDKKLAAGPGIVVGRKGNPGIVTWAHSDFFPIDTTFYVVPRNTEGDLPFLFFALTTQDLPSIAADSAVPGLNRNLAYMNRQLVPDKQVIDEFNHYASEIFTRRHRLEEESRTLAALRDALLPKLMSGELWVRDAKQFTRRTI